MAELPALMQPGTRNQSVYYYPRLNVPAGATTNPQATQGGNYNALDGHWPAGQHSAFRDRSFPEIYKWWNEFLGNGLAPESRIPLGEE